MVPAVTAVSYTHLDVYKRQGTTLAIRIDQRISAKTSRAGDKFTGEIVDPILASDSGVLVPKGCLLYTSRCV